MAYELVMGLGIFNTLFETAKGLKEINDVSVRTTATLELLNLLSTAKEQSLALLDRIGDLEKKLAALETWDHEKNRYELHKTGAGTFLYRLKPLEADTEPPHEICAHCYQNSKKSILQLHRESQCIAMMI